MARNFVTAFASAMGSRLLLLASSVVLTPAIIAFAGRSVYGQYGTLMAGWAMAVIVMSEGVHSGLRKYLAEERAMEGWKDHVFGFYVRLGLVLAVLTAAGFVFVAESGLVGRIWNDELVPFVFLLAPLAIVVQFRGIARQTLNGLKLETISEPLRVVHKVLFAMAGIAITYVGYGVGGLVAGQLVASLLAGVVGLYFLGSRVSWRHVLKRTPEEFPTRELFVFNVNSVVYTFLLMSLYHVDVLMLSSHATSTEVAYYKGALVITQFLWFIPRALQSLMLQSTSNFWAQGQLDRIESMARRLVRYILLLTLLLAIGMGALAADFVPLYLGEEMRPTITPLLILLPGTVGFAIARPLLSISHASGDLKPPIVATGIAAVSNLGLNALLIPEYGIIGAAVATSVGYGSLAALQTGVARYLGYAPFSHIRLGSIVTTAVLSAVPIVWLSRTVESPVLALLLVPVVGFAVYSLLSLLTGAVELDELFDILESAPAPVSERAAAVRARVDAVVVATSLGEHSLAAVASKVVPSRFRQEETEDTDMLNPWATAGAASAHETESLTTRQLLVLSLVVLVVSTLCLFVVVSVGGA
jgi:O-antigen/teichoic acid export membrane protein